MKERIIEFLRAENKTSAQFAEQIGVQPSAVSHILSGRNNPSLDFVLKMLNKYPYLSVEWLLFGKGPMYRENQMQSLFSDQNAAEKAGDDAQGGQDFWVNIDESVAKDVKDRNESVESTTESPSRTVSRIVWFYSDNTFTEYLPS